MKKITWGTISKRCFPVLRRESIKKKKSASESLKAFHERSGTDLLTLATPLQLFAAGSN